MINRNRAQCFPPVPCWLARCSDRVTFPDHLSPATLGPARNLHNEFEQGGGICETFQQICFCNSPSTHKLRLRECEQKPTQPNIPHGSRPNWASRSNSAPRPFPRSDERSSINLLTHTFLQGTSVEDTHRPHKDQNTHVPNAQESPKRSTGALLEQYQTYTRA